MRKFQPPDIRGMGAIEEIDKSAEVGDNIDIEVRGQYQ